MNNLELWKLIIDAMLMLSLGWLAIRFVRGPGAGVNSGKIAELDASLRSLLRDADQSSRALNDQLLKRQRDIEKVLYDAETVEQRVNRIVTSVEERKGSLEAQIGRAEATARTVEAELTRLERAAAEKISSARLASKIEVEAVAVKTEERRFEADLEPETVEEIAVPVMTETLAETEVRHIVRLDPEDEAPEPPSFESSVQQASPIETHINSRRAVVVDHSLSGQVEKEVSADTRILNEAVESRKTSQIEKEVITEQSLPPALNTSLQNVYKAAHRAMQAGKRVAPSAPSAEEVSPVDDSITISGKPDMVFQAAPQQAGRDPRLGVLGGIKRQVQIF